MKVNEVEEIYDGDLRGSQSATVPQPASIVFAASL
jgi:hypothetical protein